MTYVSTDQQQQAVSCKSYIRFFIIFRAVAGKLTAARRAVVLIAAPAPRPIPTILPLYLVRMLGCRSFSAPQDLVWP